MENLKRFQELKEKINQLGGYFYLSMPEKKEYSELAKNPECVEWTKQKQAEKVESIDLEATEIPEDLGEKNEELEEKTTEDVEVEKAMNDFQIQDAEAKKDLSVFSLSTEDVKNDLWTKIKDGAARAAVLSMSSELSLIDELKRIREDKRITVEGSYAGLVQQYIDKLTV